MSKYLILIYEDEAAYDAVAPEAWAAMLDAHNAFAKAVVELGGQVLSGEALEPAATATAIRGGALTDGPFFETKEALGGFYVIDARDLDHALEISKRCPSGTGGVEVRPIRHIAQG
jgi:hypothetical protein